MISLRAYAKINLGLRILEKRSDGYHDIETVFHRIDIFDEISIEEGPVITLSVAGSPLPADDRNLCVKAAKLLQERSGITTGARITLKKNIPVGAGLGGGSSDAASTLTGLARLWNLDLRRVNLSELALKLGSDVPYFLKPGSAYAKGRGEVLEYFDFDIPYWTLTAYPDVHISTAWAYAEIEKRDSNPRHPPQRADKPLRRIVSENIGDLRNFSAAICNDFEPVVLHRFERVAYTKIRLYALGAEFAQMSGSGSAIYAFFTDERTVKGAMEMLKENNLVFLTPPGFSPDLI